MQSNLSSYREFIDMYALKRTYRNMCLSDRIQFMTNIYKSKMRKSKIIDVAVNIQYICEYDGD